MDRLEKEAIAYTVLVLAFVSIVVVVAILVLSGMYDRAICDANAQLEHAMDCIRAGNDRESCADKAKDVGCTD